MTPSSSAAPAVDTPTTYLRPTDWPAAALLPTTFDPRRASLVVGDHGDLRLMHLVDDVALDVLAARWAETLTHGGYTPREPCTDAPSHACVWTGHDRLVVTAAWPDVLGRGIVVSAHWLPVGHVPLARLPGKCVTPPTIRRTIRVLAEGTDQSGNFRSSTTQHEITTHPSLDVDGDGRIDVLVPHATHGKCPWDVPHDVYVMRGDCGHEVGTIVGRIDEETHTSSFHRGLRRIHTEATWATGAMPNPLPGRHTRLRAFTFDGRRLEKTADETESGVCHHCGVVTCIGE